MNTTNCKRGSQNRHPHRNHLLTALLVAVMVMLLTLPAFAAETAVSESTPDWLENPAGEDGTVTDEVGATESTLGPVSTAEELLDAIAHASENDVIEFDAAIQMPYNELVLGRADCPITIRRAIPEARLLLGDFTAGNIKVQNITFDGAGIRAIWPFVSSSSPIQIFEKCNFVNCVAENGEAALSVGDGEVFISDCHFSNNIGGVGAHFRTNSRRATIENCTFTDGYAIYKGPVFIMTTEETLMIGCTVSENSAGEQAGGVYVGRGALSIAESKIYGNTANGTTDDITKDYWARLSLVDNYAELIELYKPDGVIPNRWTVDSRFNGPREMDPYHADMVFSMTFADNEPSPPPSPASITLDQSELTLYVGEADTLTAMLHPEGANSSIQWTSSDPSVASVTESGLIIAHSAGTASITATATVGGASASCLVTVQEAPATTYSISISASPTEGGTVSGSGQYEESATATVTAVANEGFRFLEWTEAGTQISTEASLTFTVTNDRTLTAIFEPISGPAPGPTPKPTYTINVSTAEGGTASGGGEYEQGSSVTLTATPENGYRFIAWTENDEQISTDENYTFIADRDRTLVAKFTPIPKPTYTVQVSSTQGGVAEGGGSYKEGEFITVNAVPDAGYRFLRWEENGVQVSTEARYYFAAETDRTLVAVFELIPQSEPDSTYVPGTPSTSYRPNGGNTQPTTTSLPSRIEVQIPALTNGKTTLIAPDDSFWGGYKTGRDNGAGTVTRADLAQLVYFMMDTESVKIHGVTQSPFRDVESGAWYEAAVGTLQNAGIMVGCGDDLFCPDRILTWGELLTVFARFTEDEPLTEYYTGEHWAKDSVNKAFTLGWLEYTEIFDPGRIVTTGEMVDLIQEVFR